MYSDPLIELVQKKLMELSPIQYELMKAYIKQDREKLKELLGLNSTIELFNTNILKTNEVERKNKMLKNFLNKKINEVTQEDINIYLDENWTLSQQENVIEAVPLYSEKKEAFSVTEYALTEKGRKPLYVNENTPLVNFLSLEQVKNLMDSDIQYFLDTQLWDLKEKQVKQYLGKDWEIVTEYYGVSYSNPPFKLERDQAIYEKQYYIKHYGDDEPWYVSGDCTVRTALPEVMVEELEEKYVS